MTPLDRSRRLMARMTRFPPRKCLFRVSMTKIMFRSKTPKNENFVGGNRRFKPNLKITFLALTYLALRSSGPWQDNGQQEFAICSCLYSHSPDAVPIDSSVHQVLFKRGPPSLRCSTSSSATTTRGPNLANIARICTKFETDVENGVPQTDLPS